ncbi:hypothetical protein TNIN_312721 [Trichonephila inaurata madagascariensis]|uniref:Uncharacterized protein n=1 Tax=Trichonephila inaurata madagascariensis TaxID=2747483 RepID=A0A8X6YM61_9ARAC|nr:hypothetical protein TNIN_312721 [Trichonephila inaurata madagascariensis]
MRDEPKLQPVINKDEGMPQNSPNNLKTSWEINYWKPLFGRQLWNNDWTDTPKEVYNEPLKFSVRDITHFRHDSLTEGIEMPSSKTLIGYGPNTCSRCNSNSESNANELYFSLNPSEKEIGRFEKNPLIDSSLPSMSSEFNRMEIYSQRMKKQLHRIFFVVLRMQTDTI